MDNEILPNEPFPFNPIPQQNPYIVYVKLNAENCITAVNSSTFLTDTDGWTEIDSGYGDKYYHAQGNYFDKPIMDERGIRRYKLEDGNLVERTQEEMDSDYAARPPAPPSDKERIAALEAQLASYEAAYEEGVNEA